MDATTTKGDIIEITTVDAACDPDCCPECGPDGCPPDCC
jgi:hypothetical protein